MGISAAAVTDVRTLRIVPSILLLARCGYGILTITQRTLAPNLSNATGEAEDNHYCGGHLTSYAGNIATVAGLLLALANASIGNKCLSQDI